MDAALCEYFDLRYFEGGTSDEGGKLLAAVSFFETRFYKNTASTLPHSSRALRGWIKNGPAEQRLPFPLVALYVVASHLVKTGCPDHGLCLLMQLNAYLRPGEIVNLQVKQLVAPLRGARPPYNQWGVNIAPFELPKPSTTGLYDESVTLDNMEWAHPLLEALVAGRLPSDQLFRLTLPELSLSFGNAVIACHFAALKPCLYSLRHGGASEDLLRGRRDIDGVFRRGRWRAWSIAEHRSMSRCLSICETGGGTFNLNW